MHLPLHMPPEYPCVFSIIVHSKIKTSSTMQIQEFIPRKILILIFMIYQSCITFIFISLIEHVYSFTVRTINDAAESIRISDPSEAVSCKTKAMGKISILMKMLIELFFVSVLRNFLAMLRLFCLYQRISDINLTHKKSNCFKQSWG